MDRLKKILFCFTVLGFLGVVLIPTEALAIPGLVSKTRLIRHNTYAPYVDIAGLGSKVYAYHSLQDIFAQAHIHHLTLAFVLGDHKKCRAEFYGIYSSRVIQKQIRAYRYLGGHLFASFGGFGGTMVANNCKSVAALERAYASFVRRYKIYNLDFDIEGYYVKQYAMNRRRARALALLEHRFPMVHVSLTLPATPLGLARSGRRITQGMINNGVVLTRINIMTMNFGNMLRPPYDMGISSMRSGSSLHKQIMKMYPHISSARAWAMIGLTPMVGENNHRDEIFTQQDARDLIVFARSKGIRFLANWSVNRDQECRATINYASPICSNVRQKTYEFSRIFNHFAMNYTSAHNQQQKSSQVGLWG